MESEIATLEATTTQSMWISELLQLEREYDAYKLTREQLQRSEPPVKKASKQKLTIVKRPKAK
jgi:hypothetical protein